MKIRKLFLRGLLATLLFAPLACEKNDDGSYVEPITIYESIYGKWELTALKQFDELAIAAGTKPNEETLTSKFNFSTFKITLNADSTSSGVKPTTYEVTGSAPELFEPKGYWDLDHAFTRVNANGSRIRLYSDAAKTKLTDEFLITTFPGVKPNLEFKLIRYSAGTPYVSYLYSLKPSK